MVNGTYKRIVVENGIYRSYIRLCEQPSKTMKVQCKVYQLISKGDEELEVGI